MGNPTYFQLVFLHFQQILSSKNNNFAYDEQVKKSTYIN